jgi:hypothetical protein
MKMLKPPGASLILSAAYPFARKASTPFSLIRPGHLFERVFNSPSALFESLSSRIFLVKAGSFGPLSFQFLADSNLKSPPASGKGRDSINFCLLSFSSRFSCEEVIAWRLLTIALWRSPSSSEDESFLPFLFCLLSLEAIMAWTFQNGPLSLSF